ncbi:MAG: hypothetical protein HYX74_09560 [Acidobacteria bacterium]|nr:hypothetical protein [Acidobacteriota bacterium]
MTCPDAEREILSQIDGSQPSPELKAHLACCEACGALLAQIAEVDSVFCAGQVFEPGPFLWTRIQSRLDVRPTGFGWLYRLAIPGSAWLTVSLLVLLSLLFTASQNESPGSQDLALAQYDLSLQAVSSVNPFLVAQDGGVNGSNPFLEAMMPGEANPFKLRRVP